MILPGEGKAVYRCYHEQSVLNTESLLLDFNKEQTYLTCSKFIRKTDVGK